MTDSGVLYQVVNIQEAAALFFLHPNTIRYRVDRGDVEFRQLPDGVYLISLASLEAIYGKAICKPNDYTARPKTLKLPLKGGTTWK